MSISKFLCLPLVVVLTASHLSANQTDETRNNLLFEKLYSQNKRLWSFITETQKSESRQTAVTVKPDELRVKQLAKVNHSKKVDNPEDNVKVAQLTRNKQSADSDIADYLSNDPADSDLELEEVPEYGQYLKTKGIDAQYQLDTQKIHVAHKNKSKSPNRKTKYKTKIEKVNSTILETKNSSEPEIVHEPKNGPNALQRAWNSAVKAAKSIGQPKPLEKKSKRRNFKLWSFQIGLRNLVNNDSDGFKHDAEIYHQLGYRLNDRQKLFAEYKNVTMTGDGFGKVSRTGVGYQHYLKSVNEVASFYPYFAFFYDHWVGNFESFKGVSLLDGKDSKSVFTTRLGVEYPLTDTTNLDLYWERGKKFLSFTDSLGNEIEVHSRSNLYGMGLSHAF